MEIPESLRWTDQIPAGRAWRAVLPDRLAECVAQWDLRVVGPPFEYAFASLAVPVELPDGTPAVLKLHYPDDDSVHEATALAHWPAGARSGCWPTTRNGGRCWWSAACPACGAGRPQPAVVQLRRASELRRVVPSWL